MSNGVDGNNCNTICKHYTKSVTDTTKYPQIHEIDNVIVTNDIMSDVSRLVASGDILSDDHPPNLSADTSSGQIVSMRHYSLPIVPTTLGLFSRYVYN